MPLRAPPASGSIRLFAQRPTPEQTSASEPAQKPVITRPWLPGEETSLQVQLRDEYDRPTGAVAHLTVRGGKQTSRRVSIRTRRSEPRMNSPVAWVGRRPRTRIRVRCVARDPAGRTLRGQDLAQHEAADHFRLRFRDQPHPQVRDRCRQDTLALYSPDSRRPEGRKASNAQGLRLDRVNRKHPYRHHPPFEGASTLMRSKGVTAVDHPYGGQLQARPLQVGPVRVAGAGRRRIYGPGVRSTAASAVAASASRTAAPSRALDSART